MSIFVDAPTLYSGKPIQMFCRKFTIPFFFLVMVASFINIEKSNAQVCKNECESCEAGRRSGSQYCSEDPWIRGRIWLKQTGHFGWFYNCDCEEDKRKSPYICWKKSDSPFSGERFFECIRCDIRPHQTTYIRRVKRLLWQPVSQDAMPFRSLQFQIKTEGLTPNYGAGFYLRFDNRSVGTADHIAFKMHKLFAVQPL